MIKLLEILSEVGEANIKPYDYEQMYGDEDRGWGYRFETDQNLKYDVFFERLDPEIDAPGEFALDRWDDIYEVQFRLAGFIGIDRSSGTRSLTRTGYTRMSGANEPLKIMSTIMRMTQEFIHESDADYLMFSSTNKDQGSTGSDPIGAQQKARLYLAYLKKAGKTVEKQVGDKYLINLRK